MSSVASDGADRARRATAAAKARVLALHATHRGPRASCTALVGGIMGEPAARYGAAPQSGTPHPGKTVSRNPADSEEDFQVLAIRRGDDFRSPLHGVPSSGTRVRLWLRRVPAIWREY